jgi:peroxiredoxin
MVDMSAQATVGQPAPAIELTDRNGSPWRLASQRGKTIVLIFHRHIH